LQNAEDVAASLLGIEEEPDESGNDFLNRLARRFEIFLAEKLPLERNVLPR